MAEDKAIIYNNAGVSCYKAGLMKVAFTFFKAALEVNLRTEISDSHLRCQVLEENNFVSEADDHLKNLDQLLAPESNNQTSENVDQSKDLQISQGIYFYKPFLYEQPFLLPIDTIVTSERKGATVIFNLAVLDHTRRRASASPKSMQLYELSMTLAVHDNVRDDDELILALTNNIGVWNFENGNLHSAHTCMKWLEQICGAVLLGGAQVQGRLTNLDETTREGLRSNILVLLQPLFWASPAA